MSAPTAADDLEDLFENAPCGYVSADGGGRILRANRTFADWLGFERDALAGRKVQELLNIAGRIYYETHFAPLLKMQGSFNEVALDFVAADGARISCLVNAVERRDADDALTFIRMTIFKAADRRLYEEQLLEARRTADMASQELRELNATLESRVEEAVAERLQAEEALRQAQKMEVVGQLTGGVAHDFNNLLTVIIGGLETIGRVSQSLPDEAVSARIRRARDMALHGAQRAATLTARLLAFSRRQALNPRALQANRLLAGLTDMLQRTLGETIELETVCAAGLWLAMADAGELENALVNLAVNARDAMPAGGRLTIETGNAWLDQAYVDALAEPVPPGQYAMIAVSDTGSGMDAATLERVFEPFFTTKEVGRGTGLGLSQVYGFVRQTGGHVRIYSEPGEGTTVKIYLPRALGEEAVAAPAPAPARPADGGGETILVVEDHADLRAFSAGVLRELGYRVLEAANGREALALLAGEPQVALLFTDVVLPEGMDGRRLADTARADRGELRVLFTTGYTRNAIVHNGRLDPGVELITKPFTYAELAAKVRSLLDT